MENSAQGKIEKLLRSEGQYNISDGRPRRCEASGNDNHMIIAIPWFLVVLNHEIWVRVRPKSSREMAHIRNLGVWTRTRYDIPTGIEHRRCGVSGDFSRTIRDRNGRSGFSQRLMSAWR